MGISLGEYVKERKDITIETPVGELHITYNPHAITPSDEARLMSARTDSASSWYQQLLTMLEQYIIQWDAYGPIMNKNTGEEIVAEGDKIPTQADVLQHIPVSLMTKVYTAIAEDNSPKVTKISDRQTKKTSPQNSGGVFESSFE